MNLEIAKLLMAFCYFVSITIIFLMDGLETPAIISSVGACVSGYLCFEAVTCEDPKNDYFNSSPLPMLNALMFILIFVTQIFMMKNRMFVKDLTSLHDIALQVAILIGAGSCILSIYLFTKFECKK